MAYVKQDFAGAVYKPVGDGSDVRDCQLEYHHSRGENRGYRRALIASVAVNILFCIWAASYVLFRQHDASRGASRFAGLHRNIAKPWVAFDVQNDTAQDEIWASTTWDAGNIALADDYARAAGLPRAQRFPWDESKGIYLINGYHNLHCVVTLRQSLAEYHSNTTQTEPWGHVKHCLMVLRDEIMCNADDTPRYTGFQADRASGLGQKRMCRDWSRLESWATEHSGCWRHIGHVSDPGFRELDRYRFCPPDSPYKAQSETAWLDDIHLLA